MPTIASLARLFFSFHGRAGRPAFWLVSLTWFLIVEVFDYWWSEHGVMALVGRNHLAVNAALVLVSLPPFASCLAVTVRRLHDRNKGAWWLLPFIICPAALQIAATLLFADALEAGPAVVLMLASIVLAGWAWVELGFLPGTTGPNRYGLDPSMGAAMG